MRPISLSVPEDSYREMEHLASLRGQPVAELLREAMTDYLRREAGTDRSVLDLPAHPGGALLGAWRRSELFDEMLGE